jgi:hypothetical protein
MLPAMWMIWMLACTGDEPEPEGPFLPTGRTASVGFVDEQAETLWIAGGRTTSGITDDTLGLDLTTGDWTPGPPSGEPLARAGCAAGGAGAIVFGGTSDFDQETDHTWIWVPGDNMPWAPASTGPPARAWHASAWSAGQLWVHGGRQDDDDVVLFEDLWSYDPTADVWTEHLVSPGGPGGRYRHAMTWLDGQIWIHGGLDVDGERSNKLWSYDVTAAQWQQRELGLPAPSARASHALQTLGDALWLWGGDRTDDSVWIRGASEESWTEITPEVSPPLREDAMTAPVPGGAGLWIFGGELADGSLASDVWQWDPTTTGWTELLPLDDG